MKKLLPFILLTSLLLSACSIDWSGDKDKKIAELERQIQDDTFKKQKECIEFFDKNKEKLYGNEQSFHSVSVFYGEKWNTCYYAFSVSHTGSPNTPNTKQFMIDNLFTKEAVFTSMVTNRMSDQIAEWQKFDQKIKELKWE
jgi:hypothetical protein